MHLYLAGTYTSSFGERSTAFNRLTDSEREKRLQVDHFLESYHYIHKEGFVEQIREDGKKVFLDSGAFSAFTKGVEVDLPAFCRYIHDKADIILFPSVLDGIGDPLKTYENQKRMEDLGAPPLPCFHYGEDERYLEYYIENYEYMTLGGMVPISTPQLHHWLDRMWGEYLTNPDGTPKIKVHGFGLTSAELMVKYPWYSVDSSSWVQGAANGNVFFPDIGMIPISSQSYMRKNFGQHFTTYPQAWQDHLRERIEALGFDVERLTTLYQCRWAFNAYQFAEFGRQITKDKGANPTFQVGQMGLF